jgi:hypothetical protein
MWHSARLRLLVCLAAGLAAFGMQAYGSDPLRSLQLPEPQQVLASHGDAIAGTVATRAEPVARDEAKRFGPWFGPLFALGACALALLAVGHHRRGIVLASALAPAPVHFRSTSPRAPPLGQP